MQKITEDGTECSALSVGAHFLRNIDKSFKGLNVITTTLQNVKKSTVPIFYQLEDMISTRQQLHFKRLITEMRGLLQEEVLSPNSVIVANAQPLYYFNWMQKGIMKVKHIWDRGKGTFTPSKIQ